MRGKVWLLVSLLGGLFVSIGDRQAQAIQTNDCYSRDPARAIAQCTVIIGLWPKDTRGWMDYERSDAFNNRGVAYDRLGQMELALADFDEAIRVDPSNQRAFANRARFRLVQGDYNRALADYNRALRSYNRGFRSPRAAEPSRGVLYYSHDGAYWRTDTGVWVDALAGRADTYVRLGQIDRAITDYDHAALIDPKNATILNNRGSAYAKKSDYDRAIADFGRAIEIAHNPIVFANRGVAYVKAGQYGVAIRDLDEALKVNPNDAVALYHRGVARQNIADTQGGADDIMRARQIDPTLGP